MLTHTVFTTNLQGRYSYSHSTDKETEPQRNKSLTQIHIDNKQKREIQTQAEMLQSP